VELGGVKYLSQISKLEKKNHYGKCKKWLQTLCEISVLINLLFSKIIFQNSLINYLDGQKKKLKGITTRIFLLLNIKVFYLQQILDSEVT